MAQFPSFSSPSKSMLSSILEGYEGFNRPMNLLQEQQQRRLANEQQQIQNQFLPKGLEQKQEQMRLANIFQQAREPYANQLAQNETQLQQAQIHHATTGKLGQMLYDMNKIVNQYGFNSPEAEQAREYLQRKIEGPAGQQFSFDPANGGFTFSQGGPAGGSKGGSKPMLAPDGSIVTQPTSGTENKIQERQLGKEATDVFERVKQPYVGKGSNDSLRNDIKRYEKTKDPEIFSKLVETALAYKLAPEKAAVMLSLSGVTATKHALEKQEKAIKQGWPELGTWLTNNLPPEVQEAVNQRHDEILKEAHDAQVSHAKRFLPYHLQNLPGKETPEAQPEQKERRAGFTYHPEYSDEDLIATLVDPRNNGMSLPEIIERLEARKHG